MHQPRMIAGLLGGLIATGCRGAEKQGMGSTARVDTLPDGWIAVTNEQARWSAQTAWRLEEDLRIGSVQGAPHEQFARIYGLTTDDAGRIYVLENQAQEIRVFHPDGAFSHTIGGPGGGPGEFGDANGIGWAPDGRLVVWDPGAGRFSVFERDGGYVTSHRRHAVGYLYPWNGGFRADGNYYDWTIAYTGEPARPGGAGAHTVYYPISLGPDFASMDTLPPVEYDREMASSGVARPFAGRVTFHHDLAGRLWLADTRAYRVFQRTIEGDTVLTFEAPAAPVAVTESEADSTLRWQRENWPPELRMRRDDFPATKPIIHRIFGDAGTLFIVVETEGSPAGSHVDAFSEEGVFLGRMRFPEPIVLPLPKPHATAEHIYAVITDDLEVQHVARFRIVRP